MRLVGSVLYSNLRIQANYYIKTNMPTNGHFEGGMFSSETSRNEEGRIEDSDDAPKRLVDPADRERIWQILTGNGVMSFPIEIASNPPEFAKFLKKFLETQSVRAMVKSMGPEDWEVLRNKVNIFLAIHAEQMKEMDRKATEFDPSRKGRIYSLYRNRQIGGACTEYFFQKSVAQLHMDDASGHRFEMFDSQRRVEDDVPLRRSDGYHLEVMKGGNVMLYRQRRRGDLLLLTLENGREKLIRDVPYTEADAMGLYTPSSGRKILYVFDATSDGYISQAKDWRDVVVGKAVHPQTDVDVVSLNIFYCDNDTYSEKKRQDNGWYNLYLPTQDDVGRLTDLVSQLPDNSAYDSFRAKVKTTRWK